jgi:hypothetical protein
MFTGLFCSIKYLPTRPTALPAGNLIEENFGREDVGGGAGAAEDEGGVDKFSSTAATACLATSTSVSLVFNGVDWLC